MTSAADRIAQYAKQFPPLTDEQERDLGERGCQGDVEAQETLFRHNILYALKRCSKWMVNNQMDDDVVQDALIGLNRASKSFDGRMRFAAYAHGSIDWAIFLGRKPHLTASTIPTATASVYKKTVRAYNTCAETIREPTVDDVMAVLDDSSPRNAVVAAIHVMQGHTSMDSDVSEGGESTLHDFIGREGVKPEPPIGSSVEGDGGLRSVLMKYVDMLSDKERYTVVRYFGLDGLPPEDCMEQSAGSGVSHQAISFRLQAALARFRGDTPPNRLGPGVWAEKSKVMMAELKEIMA